MRLVALLLSCAVAGAAAAADIRVLAAAALEPGLVKSPISSGAKRPTGLERGGGEDPDIGRRGRTRDRARQQRATSLILRGC